MSASRITLAIPSYGRPAETRALLESILAADDLPDEVLLCEDMSPQREEIRARVLELTEAFHARGTTLTWHENEHNLGFDRNLKALIRNATGDFVMWMGNDDKLLKTGMHPVRNVLEKFPATRFFSCAYVQFDGATDAPLHLTRHFDKDVVVSTGAGNVFKLSSFISGTIVNRPWALERETDTFDGGLFYQVYLAACAWIEGGIGYVSEPIVGSRRGGVPLFGAAATEKREHAPGRIAVRGRTGMYRSVLEIARHLDREHGSLMTEEICKELDSRQIFHVYEDFVGRPRTEVLELFRSLRSIGMGRSFVHKLCFATALTGGPLAAWAFRKARSLRDSH